MHRPKFRSCARSPYPPRIDWTWKFCTSGEPLKYEVQALIIDYSRKEVLLQQEGHHWVLPGMLIDEDNFQSTEEPMFLIRDFENALPFNIKLFFVRRCWFVQKEIVRDNYAIDLSKAVIAMEGKADELEHLGHYRWIALEKATVFHHFKEAIAAIQREQRYALEGNEPPKRAPWQRPGWFVETSTWMQDTLLDVCDAILTDPICQLRASAFGTILQANTTKGRFFLKCTPHWANDASYTKVLSEIAPEFVAKPVIVDLNRQIMITEDYGEVLRTFKLSGPENEKLATDYAILLQKTIGKEDELIKAGFLDLRPERLMEHVDRICRNPEVIRYSADADCDDIDVREEVRKFCSHGDRIKKELRVFQESNLPVTVAHNDLVFTNFYKPEDSDNYMFFDWCEGYISHVFISDLDAVWDSGFIEHWRQWDTMENLERYQSTGRKLRQLAVMIQRINEAYLLENSETGEVWEDVYSALEVLNEYFKDGN